MFAEILRSMNKYILMRICDLRRRYIKTRGAISGILIQDKAIVEYIKSIDRYRTVRLYDAVYHFVGDVLDKIDNVSAKYGVSYEKYDPEYDPCGIPDDYPKYSTGFDVVLNLMIT